MKDTKITLSMNRTTVYSFFLMKKAVNSLASALKIMPTVY